MFLKSIFFLGLSLSSIYVFGQSSNTVVFKPGPTTGKSAELLTMDGGCIPSNSTQTPGSINVNNHIFLGALDWTFGSLGCPRGRKRSVLKFDQLSSIPATAVITGAELKLYGVATNAHESAYNSYYPGSPYTSSNESVLRRITAPWDANTVTFYSQPAFSTTDQLLIPPSTAQWNDDWTSNSTTLVNMVQDWVSNPTTNYGLVFMLVNENYYRSRNFSSCNAADSTLWPELIVTYTEAEDTCNTDFSYTFTSENPYQAQFNANLSSAQLTWTINGTQYSGANLTHSFGTSGNYDVCLEQTLDSRTCPTTCVNICMDQPSNSIKDKYVAGIETNVSPNPSTAGWNINIKTKQALLSQIELLDVAGKRLFAEAIALSSGKNEHYISGEHLSAGVYFLVVTSKDGRVISNSRLIKK